MKLLAKGTYVLATKYDDGDPQDQWSIGFYDGVTAPHYDPPRYNVVDNDGKQFRGNGFRRVEEISKERGEWILKHAEEIAAADFHSGYTIWYFARCPMDGQKPEELISRFIDDLTQARMEWQKKTTRKPVAMVVGQMEKKALLTMQTIEDRRVSAELVGVSGLGVRNVVEGMDIHGLRVVECAAPTELRIV